MGQGLALQMGVHWTRSKGLPGTPPIPTFAYYVDSVAGDDSNPGTEAEPFQSVSVIPWADGISVGIKRGSYFRETIAPTTDGVSINTYGSDTDPLPVFDCADPVVTTWTLDSGNIWYTDVTTDDDQFTHYNSLWKDGVRMEWFSSTAELTDDDDYFVASAPSLGTTTARFYIFSSTDPNSSGAVYEYASRWYGVLLGGNSVVRYMRTKRNLHNNGSTVIGENSQAQYCIFEDGVKHNSYSGRDSTMFRCIWYKCDWPKRDNFSAHVGHTNDGTDASSNIQFGIWVGEEDKVRWGNSNGAAIDAWQFHTDGTDGHDWASVLVTDCAAAYFNNAVVVNDTVSYNVSRVYGKDGFYGFTAGGVDGYFADNKLEEDVIPLLRGMSINTTNNAILERNKIYYKSLNDGAIYDTSTAGNLILNNNVLYREESNTGYAFHVRTTNAGRLVQLHKNVFYCNQNQSEMAAMQIEGGIANLWFTENFYSGSPNADVIFNSGADFFASYADVAADSTYGWLWQDSVVSSAGNAVPYITNAPDDFTNTSDSPGNAIGAGIGLTDSITYLPIPSYAEVDAM